MTCPECKDQRSRVIETKKYETVITRVRKCKNCGQTWSTSEESSSHMAQDNYFPAYSTR